MQPGKRIRCGRGLAAPDLKLDPRDGPFGVAVSGGADSLALLLLCEDSGLPIRAVTVDHGLRPAARGEAAWVSRLCAARGIAHDTVTLTLSDGPDLQNRARQARYDALTGWARSHALGAVVLGHTADDIAETFLMRLADGAGLDGLAAMARRFEQDGIAFLRPIHDLYKTDTRRIVAEKGLTPIEDPSNEDSRFERVRIRRLLAGLEIPRDRIVASARALREARTSAEQGTAAHLARIASTDRGDLLLQRSMFDALQSVDQDQARRILLAGLRWINNRPYPPRRAEQEELLRRTAAGQTTTLGGCLLTFEGGALRLSREPTAASRAQDVEPGSLWDGRWVVERDSADAREFSDPPSLRIRTLGDGILGTPWRDSGLPRRSVLASPAVWDGATLVAAPLAGVGEGWLARCEPMAGAAKRR